MNKKYIALILGLIAINAVIYRLFVLPNVPSATPLSPPSMYHWFGTDINANDIFIKTMVAFVYELVTLLIVLSVIGFLGLISGLLTSALHIRVLKDLFMNFIHYIATLPILLIALFLLIIFGSGFFNAVIILSLSLIPTQALFVYNQLESARNEEFVLAKQSYGMTNTAIYKSHLLPFITKPYISYTLSRMPEIIMMSLALNFLGLGLQEPHPSLGRMLFDGLAFMFSAWWLWVFSTIATIFLFYLLRAFKI
ncbi:MAG: ABC transporter permease subunit [Bacteroidia bacterium]|nr:ABC transporter permease subunit [Bacteroidia bacterium]